MLALTPGRPSVCQADLQWRNLSQPGTAGTTQGDLQLHQLILTSHSPSSISEHSSQAQVKTLKVDFYATTLPFECC